MKPAIRVFGHYGVAKGLKLCDTLELEVRYMRRAFGPLWSLLLKRAGLPEVETRKDMTRLVESMLAWGL